MSENLGQVELNEVREVLEITMKPHLLVDAEELRIWESIKRLVEYRQKELDNANS